MGPTTSISLLAQNRLLLEAIVRILQNKPDFSVVHAGAYAPDAVAKIASTGCDVLLVGSTVTDMFGLGLVRDATEALPGLKVILVAMEEDEETFVKAVSAGAIGYILKDASATDVVAAIRAVARDEASCPPRLCLSLFRYVARMRADLPNARVKDQLGLTRRQQQLIPLLAQGLTNKEIALQLNLSEQTVKNHVHRMMQRVGAEDRLSVVEIVRLGQAFV